MAEIQLSGIRKSFGETRVLNGIDLTIREGEFLTLVGPSGCGKSTLLRIIAGLEAQDEGDVVIRGRRVNGVRASDRDLAMVFQSYALYPHLTVRENMMTPLRLRDLSVLQRLPVLGRFVPGTSGVISEISEAVRETAETLKIEPLLQRKPGQLSGGQRQRAALGRAMVRRPVAFLMDEPLSNLDAALRVHMRAELSDLHRRLATTFIYVTHDQAEALTMSSRVAVMMDGDILQLDTPAKVYTDPETQQVAEFVGSPKINILDAQVGSGGDINAFGFTMPVKIPNGPFGAIRVGLRPEHLTVKSAGEQGFAAVVRHIENLGSDVFVHASLEDGKAILVARTDPEGAFALSHGTPVSVCLTGHAPLLFKTDGSRIRPTTTEPAMAPLAREVA